MRSALAALGAAVVVLAGCTPDDDGGPTVGEGELTAPPEPEPVPATGNASGPLRNHAEAVPDEWLDATAEATDIPRRALEAYAGAELWAQQTFPSCNLHWNTVAGIGAVESRHGTLDGNEIRADGTTREPIIGVPLDGSGDVAHVPDTDGGELDGDTEYDRAVGPMQFLPETWQRLGVDGSGDGNADPHHIDDAAASTVIHLCRGDADLSGDEGWVDAVFGYNQSNEYVRDVHAFAEHYVDLRAEAEAKQAAQQEVEEQGG